MSVTASLTTHLTFTVGGVVKEYGSLTTPVSISLTTGLVHETRTVVEDNYAAEVLWTTGDGNLDTFELLWFTSDADVLLELRNTAATDEFALIEVKANVPFVLNSDDMRATASGTTVIGDGSGSGTITTLKQVDQITVQRNVADAAGDATVHLVLAA